MSSSDSPQDFISKLPPAPLVTPDILEGHTPMPPTALLSESERKRLAELAQTGTPAVERAAPSDEDTLTTFSDGAFFKWMPREGFSPQCILVDAAGQTIAIVKNSNLADFLANAVNLFALAQLKHEAEGTQMQIISKPIIFPGR